MGTDHMEDGYQEYVTFHVTSSEGKDVEMAVVDEFDFENKHYVVGAVVEGDEINDDGRYIYRYVEEGDDFSVRKITNAIDYRNVAEAYMNMEE